MKMGTTSLQPVPEPDTKRHSAMQLTLLINIAAELHSIRILLENASALQKERKDTPEQIAEHAEHVYESHAQDLLTDLLKLYK